MRLKVKRTMRIDSEEPLTDGVPAHVAVEGIVRLPRSSFMGGGSRGTILISRKAFSKGPA